MAGMGQKWLERAVKAWKWLENGWKEQEISVKGLTGLNRAVKWKGL